jgi:hypothetical protein
METTDTTPPVKNARIITSFDINGFSTKNVEALTIRKLIARNTYKDVFDLKGIEHTM